MPRRGSARLTLVLVALFAFIVLPSAVTFLTKWLWFGSVGYRQVYMTGLRAQASLGMFVFVVAFFVLYGNLWFAISSIASPYIVLGTGAGTVQPAMVRREQLRRLTGVACVV